MNFFDFLFRTGGFRRPSAGTKGRNSGCPPGFLSLSAPVPRCGMPYRKPKEPLIQSQEWSARDFVSKLRFENCRNPLRISRFSNRPISWGKRPAERRSRLIQRFPRISIRGSLAYSYSAPQSGVSSSDGLIFALRYVCVVFKIRPVIRRRRDLPAKQIAASYEISK